MCIIIIISKIEEMQDDDQIRDTYAQTHLPHPLAAFILHLTRPIIITRSKVNA